MVCVQRGVATGAEAIHFKKTHIMITDQIRDEAAHGAAIAGITLTEEPVERRIPGIPLLCAPGRMLVPTGG